MTDGQTLRRIAVPGCACAPRVCVMSWCCRCVLGLTVGGVVVHDLVQAATTANAPPDSRLLLAFSRTRITNDTWQTDYVKGQQRLQEAQLLQRNHASCYVNWNHINYCTFDFELKFLRPTQNLSFWSCSSQPMSWVVQKKLDLTQQKQISLQNAAVTRRCSRRSLTDFYTFDAS